MTFLSDRPDPNGLGYFLAVIAGMPYGEPITEAKDVVFVIDRSGSMRGKKMEQAKAALKFLVERLNPEDRFNIVSYSNSADLLSPSMMEPTAAMRSQAIQMIETIEANGGTNIQEALEMALEQLSKSERLKQIVFVTDGLPTVGETNDRKISAAIKTLNKTRTRIVAFGVGFDVNGAFLDRIAAQNHGMSEYVLPTENLEAKIPDFYSRMQSPVAIDLKLHARDAQISDVYPKELPDLYLGQQIVVVGRSQKSGSVAFVLTGTRAGKPFESVFETKLSEAAGDQLVPRVWASKKIGFLIDEIRLNGTNKELVDSVVDLGTKFGILTEYTSFLAAPEVDVSRSEEVRRLGLDEFEERSRVESGGQGVAQAANSKSLQRDAYASTKTPGLTTRAR
jgi:Ca-activated chloride channel family protein